MESVPTIAEAPDKSPSTNSEMPVQGAWGGAEVRNKVAHVANPLPVYGDLQSSDENPQKAQEEVYLNNIVSSVRDEMQGVPASEAGKRPLEVNDEMIRDAERKTLHEVKESDPEYYEALLYEAEAKAELQIEELMGQWDADQLYDRVRNKAGEVLQGNNELSQKQAAAMAIAMLFEEDPSFRQINPLAYGAFHTWALANIEMNRLADENMEMNRAKAKAKVIKSK